MELTKKQAIEEHRKMWNWIAEEGYKQSSNVTLLKHVYIQKFFPEESIRHDCFCCEYACNEWKKSGKRLPLVCGDNYCPLKWGDEDELECTSYGSPYFDLIIHIDSLINPEQFKSLALQIANLPERV